MTGAQALPDSGAEPLGAALPDLERINGYGRVHIQGHRDYLSIAPIGEGYSNPTFRVDRADGSSHVLRKMPERRSATTANRIDREFRIIRALAGSDVPVPNAIHYCNDPYPIGTPFYLMDYVPGPVFTEGRMPAEPRQRRHIYLELAACMGQLHSVDFRAIGLANYARRSGASMFERQVVTMTRLYRDTETERQPDMERLIQRLKDVEWRQGGTCIVHGDFRLGNMVIKPTMDGIAAVLDWELSTLGDPLADVGYCTLMYYWDAPVFGSVMGARGVPEEAEFLDTYKRAAGIRELPSLGLYQAFSLFRLACITQAAIHRQASGHQLTRPVPAENQPDLLAALALERAAAA